MRFAIDGDERFDHFHAGFRLRERSRLTKRMSAEGGRGASRGDLAPRATERRSFPSFRGRGRRGRFTYRVSQAET